MKCPKCQTQLIIMEFMDEGKSFVCCKKCGYKSSDQKEIQALKDIQMMDEDMVFWRKAQKFR